MEEKEKNPGDACRRAMRLLEHMDRTEQGLRDKLRQSGFDETETEEALLYVKSHNYINDHRYAVNYILYRMQSQSRDRILMDLRRRGIDAQTAAEAWEEASALEEPDEYSLLCRTIEKKFASGSVLDEKEARRLYGYLARRGFHSGDIKSALEEMQITVRRPL